MSGSSCRRCFAHALDTSAVVKAQGSTRLIGGDNNTEVTAREFKDIRLKRGLAALSAARDCRSYLLLRELDLQT